MGLRLLVSGALLAAVLTLSSCLSAQLPTAAATLHWATIDLPRGSYCWNSGGRGECADSAGANDLLKTGYLKPYLTAGGLDAQITFPSASAPTRFHAHLLPTPH